MKTREMIIILWKTFLNLKLNEKIILKVKAKCDITLSDESKA